jgi:predicted nucleic acid-binding protein
LRSSSKLPDRLSVDSGVVLAYYLGERVGEIARDEILESMSRTVYHSRLCVSELFYVLCRRRGRRMAVDYTRAFLDSGHSLLCDSDEIDMTAGACKCERTISLADCYVIATAICHHASAVFARHERELDNEIKRKPFDVQVVFLEDLAS